MKTKCAEESLHFSVRESSFLIKGHKMFFEQNFFELNLVFDVCFEQASFLIIIDITGHYSVCASRNLGLTDSSAI